MSKSRIQLGLIIILVIAAVSLLLAPKATPDNTLLFGLKRYQENFFLKVKSDPASKIDYMNSMLNSRAEELDTVVKNKHYGQVLKASQRYYTLAGQMTQLIVDNNLTSQAGAAKNQFINHQSFLQKTYEYYPKNIPEDEEWKYIQDDINYLKIYLDKLSQVK